MALQIDIPKRLNKCLGIYKEVNELNSKKEAIIEILEKYFYYNSSPKTAKNKEKSKFDNVEGAIIKLVTQLDFLREENKFKPVNP